MKEEQVVLSALWAAYGDAAGFPNEFRRRGQGPLSGAPAWRRRIGGRFGVEVDLPAGSYSDDTQLRLSTCRAIRGNGAFDVQAFAKIELPVWLSYALGAGRGSKAAASSLAKKDVDWFTNFFATEATDYLEGGGNGAAMRIHPHVWSARDLGGSMDYVKDVVRNSICTHGNMRGILGAVFHAACLARALESGDLPGPDEWREALNAIPAAVRAIRNDPELSLVWVPVWEQRQGLRLEDDAQRVRAELDEQIRVASGAGSYLELADAIGGTTEKTRGCATTTAVLAAAVCWRHRGDSPMVAVGAAAEALGTDTDSVATMAGALFGATTRESPAVRVQDQEYLIAEARRLAQIASGRVQESFAYPDMLAWQPPRTGVDCVGTYDGRTVVAGLGGAEPAGLAGNKGDDEVYNWLRLDFGQTIVARVRARANPMRTGNLPVPARKRLDRETPDTQMRHPEIPQSRPAQQASLPESRREPPVDRSLHELTGEAIRCDFDPQVIGAHVVAISESRHGIERAIAYVAIVAKAIASRRPQRR